MTEQRHPDASVRVEPLGAVLGWAPDETLMEAARRQGLYWPTVCGGVGECGACRCELTAGAACTKPPAPPESNLLRRFGGDRDGRLRLACQLRLCGVGDIGVAKAGVRPR